MFTQKLSERDSIPATPVWPTSNNGTQITGAVDMSKFNRVQFLGAVGTLGANGTIDSWLSESANSNATGNTNIAGANIAQITGASNGFTIEVRADQLAKTTRYVFGNIKVAVGASVVCLFPIATELRYPPNTFDVAGIARNAV